MKPWLPILILTIAGFGFACGEQAKPSAAKNRQGPPRAVDSGDQTRLPGGGYGGNQAGNGNMPGAGADVGAGAGGDAGSTQPPPPGWTTPGDTIDQTTPIGGGSTDPGAGLSCAGDYQVSSQKAGKFAVHMPQTDKKVPLIAFNMGTGVSSGTVYRLYYPILAKHGIAVVVNPDPMSMGAKSTMEALNAAHSQFQDKLSGKLGATGHSQGGAAAWENGGKTTTAGGKIEAVAGLQPGTFPFLQGDPSVAYLNLVGGADQLGMGTNGSAYYTAGKGPKFTGVLNGADHMAHMSNPSHVGAYGKAMALWFSCHLAGSSCACEAFKSECAGLQGEVGGSWKSCKGENL